MALGHRSVSEFAVLTGVSRSAATNAEHGQGARGTYERLENWLTERESAQRSGEQQPAPEAETLEQISLHAEGEDWKFTVSGPIADREQLKADFLELVREMRRGE